MNQNFLKIENPISDEPNTLYYLEDNVFSYENLDESVEKDLLSRNIQIFHGYYKLNEERLPIIYLIGRGKNSGKIKLQVKNFFPYFYRPSKSGDYRDLFNRPCEKVIIKDAPKTVARIRDKFGRENAFEADIYFDRRFMIDNGEVFMPSEPMSPLVIYIDVETNHPISDDLISIAWAIGDSEIKFVNLRNGESLDEFIEDFKQADIATSWFADFDKEYIERLFKSRGMETEFQDTYYVDLKELVKQIINKELPSWSLEYIGSKYLGKHKKEVIRYVHELNDKDLEEYNKMDVEILRDLDKYFGAVDFYSTLAWHIHALFRDATAVAIINDILVLNTAHKHKIVLPSRNFNVKQSDDSKYSGAVILAERGVYDNVGVFDIKSMYPSLILALNASIDNLTEDYEDVIVAANGIKFKKNRKSPFVEIIRYLLDERAKIREKMKKLDVNSNRYKKLNYHQLALKRLAAAMYGLYGWSIGRVFHVGVAEAITSTAREIISFIQRKVENELGKKVIYIHTDSIFAIIDEESVSKDIENFINSELKEYCKLRNFNYTPRIEFKGFYPRAYIHAKAQNILRDKEGNLKITGMKMIKADTPLWFSNLLIDIANMILDRKEKHEILSYIKVKINKELPTLEPTEIAKTISLKKEISEYKNKAQHVKAIENAMKLFNLNPKLNERYYMLPIKHKEYDVIAFRNSEQIKDFKIDYKRLVESHLLSMLSNLLNESTKTLKMSLYNTSLGDFI